MSRGRILYLINSLAFGGAEVQVVELARAMRDRNWEPHIVGLSAPRGLEARADELGIAHSHFNFPPNTRSPHLVRRLILACRALSPAVLHTHTVPPNFAGRLARPFCRVPVLVTSAHSVNEGGAARMTFYRLTDSAADITTNVSRVAVERYVRIGAVPSASRIRYMANGVDISRFFPDEARRLAMRASLGVRPEEFLWVAVGRLAPAKDYPTLIDALARLPEGMHVRVLIAGSGPLAAQTQAALRLRGLAGKVALLGTRDDVPDLLRAADGYVMSSAAEGLPIVLLEAAATGLPVVATDVGGNAQIVISGVTGDIVPPADGVALAAAMTRWMGRSPSERRQAGALARAHIEATFEIGAVADQWDALYRELLENADHPSLAPSARCRAS